MNSIDATEDFNDTVKRDLIADVLRQFGEVRIRVTGTSMLPAVWPGDVITVRRAPARDLHPGQIVFCCRNQAFFAHRLVALTPGNLITRGDSLAFNDPPFAESELLGAVVSIQRNGRAVSSSRTWPRRALSAVVCRSRSFTRLLLHLRRLTQLSRVNA